MTQVESYLEALRQRGVHLWLEDGKLGYQAPRGTLSADDIAELRARKPELMELLRGPGNTAGPPLTASPRPATTPQSFAQQRLWFLYHLNGPDAAYNIVDRRRLLGALDVPALESAFLELCRRHEILRTTFAVHSGQPVQTVASEPALDFRYCASADAAKLAAEEAAHCFHLERGPLLRVRLVRESAKEHILLLTAHHIICDGWSLGILFRELSALYARHPLPAPALHYADYAQWQRNWLDGEALTTRLAYWKRLLDGAPAVLDLFPGHPRPTRAAARGASEPIRVPPALAQRFKQLCQLNGSTVFMGMLALLQTLLARYTQRRDIVVGTQVAGRGRPELESIVGFLVNTLALRMDVDLSKSFEFLLGRVRGAVFDAIAHQDVPFEKVVEALQPERLPGRNPIVQVMLLWQNAPIQELSLPGVRLEPFEAAGRITSKFDLTLEMGESKEGFEGVLEYRTDLYTQPEMERLAGHIVTLMESVTEQPSSRLGRLPMLRLAERAATCGLGQPDHAPLDSTPGIAARFEDQVRLHPDRPAVVFGDTTLTYAALNDRASRLAAHLLAAGARPDVPVALLMEPSSDLIVTILAILKAGSFYLPIDTRSPKARRAAMLEDSGASIVLDQLPAWLPEPCVSAEPGNLAYLIYTSGSTGTPKGVMVEQRSVLNLADWLGRSVFPPAPVRTALFASCAFDASVQQIFGCLLNGHTLYPVDTQSRRDGAALHRFLRENAIELADGTPTLLSILLETGVPADRGLALRTLLIGGEPLPARLITDFYRQDTGRRCTIYNVYGPTECCVDSTWCRVDPERRAGEVESIGRPIPNSEVLILDGYGQPVPIGVSGEVCVAGAGVGLGYWRRPALTAEAFVPHPHRAGERLYRTGDHAYWNEAGVIEFLGRTDDQVKIRGHRIQLGDVESHLVRHPAIRQAVCMARPIPGGHQELIAYLVAGAGVTIEELRRFLSAELPGYMLPAQFVILDELPISVSGKVDRKRLPQPGAAPQLRQGSHYTAPRTEAEILLAEVWKEVLGRERIGIRDHYIALGGDSIKALQIAARLRDAGWKLELGHLFLHPHIEDLAPMLQPARAGSAAGEPATGDAALSPAQARFFQTFDGGLHHFNQSNFLVPREPLEVDLLRRALEIVIGHHDALRATFHRTGQTWRQSIAEPGDPISLTVLDTNLSGAVADASQRQSLLNLEQGPLFEAVLYRTPQGQRLLLTAHHLVVDGVSWRIVLEDLERAYRHKPLPEKTTPFRSWSARLASQTEPPSAPESLPSSCAALPLDLDAPACSNRECATHRLELSRSLTSSVLEHCHHAYGTEVNDILLTALARAVRRLTARDTLPVLLESHGRQALSPDMDLSRTVGWFTAIYPVLLELGPADDPGRNLKLVKETLRAVPRVALSRPGARTHQPRVVFNYLGQFGSTAAAPQWLNRAPEAIGPMVGPAATFSHDLEINGAAMNGRLEFLFNYNPRRFRDGVVPALAEWFAAELELLAAHAMSRSTTELTPSDIDYKGFNLDEMELFLNSLPAEGAR